MIETQNRPRQDIQNRGIELRNVCQQNRIPRSQANAAFANHIAITVDGLWQTFESFLKVYEEESAEF